MYLADQVAGWVQVRRSFGNGTDRLKPVLVPLYHDELFNSMLNVVNMCRVAVLAAS